MLWCCFVRMSYLRFGPRLHWRKVEYEVLGFGSHCFCSCNSVSSGEEQQLLLALLLQKYAIRLCLEREAASVCDPHWLLLARALNLMFSASLP